MPSLPDSLRRGKRIFTEHNNIWVLLTMSLVIAALILAWWAVSDTFSVSGIGRIAEHKPAEGEPAEEVSPAPASPTRNDEINALRDTLRDLNETARMLMDSITYLETKLIRAHVLSDDLIKDEETLAIARAEPHMVQPASQPGTVSPAAPNGNGETLNVARAEPRTVQPASQPATESPAVPAARVSAEKAQQYTRAPDAAKAEDGKTARQPLKVAERPKPVTVAGSKTAEKQQPDDTAHEQESAPETRTTPPRPTRSPPETAPATAATRPTAGQTGAWVINLASLRSLKQAENFKSNAGMKGFDTSIQQANVKGIDYWRVQVTGLATREDAESRGEAIKQRLGLKDFWISRQR